jgi:hypothetical protein
MATICIGKKTNLRSPPARGQVLNLRFEKPTHGGPARQGRITAVGGCATHDKSYGIWEDFFNKER